MKTKTIISLVLLAFSVYSKENRLEKFTSLFGMELSKNTLFDVMDKFGKQRIIESGDAGDYSAKICYYLEKTNEYVVFEAGELSGGTKEILGVEISNEKDTIFKDIKPKTVRKNMAKGPFFG